MAALPIAAVAAGFAAVWWHLKKQKSTDAPKPQLKFLRILTDNSDAPFKHLQTEHGAARPSQHPFQQQIQALADKPPDILSRHMEMPDPLLQRSCKWVASLEDLQAMLREVSAAEMLAVDVEHHHRHSYLGFVCLLQLNAGSVDYVIDALALHDHLYLLRPIFANPHILKVVHGGDNDVLWLQRDFHIYMCNVFDTEKACQILGMHQRGLAKLLDMYCNISTDKSFQTSDWRVRPLTKAQRDYAQRDAQYLLYIAHRLYAELQAADNAKPDHKGPSKVMQAWQRCQRISLSLYSKQTSQAAAASAASAILRKKGISPHALDNLSQRYPDRPAQQVMSDNLHALCAWRDQAAREEDEGVQAVMPDSVLLALATECPTSESEVVEQAQQAVHATDEAIEDADPSADLQQALPLHVEEQASHIAMLLSEAASGLRLAPASSAAAGQNRNQARQLMTPEERQAAQKERLVKKFSAKSAVYENCKMYSQDGDLLCYCDLRKLIWYESRGLAERIGNDPPTIKLTFMHKNSDQERGVDDYYLHSKENKCVSCGEEGHYLRYRVVPQCYRRNFPVQWKSHRSHDIVLLCLDCHHIAHRAADRVKKELSQQYSIPLFPPKPKPQNFSPGAEAHPYNVRRAAVALKTQGHNLPEKRREELQQLVRGYVNQDKPGSQLDGGGWLSQDEMESALLAGLAPRQKRRTLRQLAVERAGNSDTQSDGAAQHHKSSGYEEGADSDSQECDMTKQAGNDVACVLESAAAGFDAQQSVADSEGHMQQQFAQHTSLDTATSNTPSEVNDDTFAVQHSDVLADQAVKHGLQGEAMTAAQHAESNGHLWHGKMVVAAAMAEGGTDALLLLIHRFRKAFTDALHPQFLPEAWHIFHNADRDFGEHSVYAS